MTPAANDHEQLIEFLESDQLVTARARPLQRRVLDRRVAIALWSLRVFVIVVGVMVIYTFFARLG
ncbi:MAG TPA: hypothetical protein VGF70_08080 [Solirubrobacteraceae bacterium]|jgi:hypothetical protein